MDIEHHYFMGLALQEARKAAEFLEVPVGAVVVDENGQTIGLAHNAPISQCDPTAHAEILAIRQAAVTRGNYRLVGSVLYVTLEPCAMCLGAMLHARIRMLVFGSGDPKSGAAGSVVDLTKPSLFNHYIEVVAGVRSEECSELLRSFFRDRRGGAKR